MHIYVNKCIYIRIYIYIYIYIYKHASSNNLSMPKENDIFHEYVYLNCNVF